MPEPSPKRKIVERLDELGHTYQSLGNEIGISPQAVSEIINGRTTGATARYALARAIGYHPEDIWGGAEAA